MTKDPKQDARAYVKSQVRLPADLVERLKATAQTENRSMNGQFVQAITEHLDARDAARNS